MRNYSTPTHQHFEIATFLCFYTLDNILVVFGEIILCKILVNLKTIP